MKLPTEKSKIVNDMNCYIFQLYGDPKVGKTTLASKWPDTLFICTEPGHKFQEVYGGDHIHETWDDIRETVGNLRKGNHEFKTVAVDIVDNAWDMCRSYVQRKLGIKHESEDKGYGRSWDMVTSEFKSVFRGLVNGGMGVIFISHSEVGTRSDNGVDRQYMDNSLKAKPRKFINGLCDFIFYCHTDTNGKRLMLTKGNPNINAGDRTGVLPERMAMDFDKLKEYLSFVDKGIIKKHKPPTNEVTK